MEREVAAIPGAADVHMPSGSAYAGPARERGSDPRQPGRRDPAGQVANDMLVSLSGTAQLSPNFWLDPKNGRQYNVLVQTPQYRVDIDQRLGEFAGRVRRHRAAITRSRRNCSGNLARSAPRSFRHQHHPLRDTAVLRRAGRGARDRSAAPSPTASTASSPISGSTSRAEARSSCAARSKA